MSFPEAEDTGHALDITATFMEIIGKTVYDLAADDADSEDRKPVKIAEDKVCRPYVLLIYIITEKMIS